ncbi:glycosyltransferase [Undibacterium curvum]|uniref:Glycosyltransferase family 2 protein n=1 Tax=Undibacterium curvum TaxID=2762294 RepID=A0ABR7A180_9BURK|nr:glycosyltransferase family 2 protein [Undibacterium curvum]MBC3930592.1 glycosyltransferase family 2 protein [Undibacterium curvum]
MLKPPDYEVLLITFSVGENINNDIADLKKELNSSGIATRALVITECDEISHPIEIEQILCGPGSKLQKIKSQLRIDVPFICVIDSDMHLEISACKELILNALKGMDGITFGLIESISEPGLLGNCIQLDKRWSHRFLRPTLHFLRVGITVPGQFVMYSPELLSSINDNSDTFLDDLYFGLKCRQLGLGIQRVNKIIGYEKGRSGWGSLFLQRIRWMKGLFRLTKDAWKADSGWLYCIIHYLAYHGIPIIYTCFIVVLVLTNHLESAIVLIGIFLLLFAYITKSINLNIVLYLIIFPILHTVATLAAIFPFSLSNLRKR